MLYRDSRLLSLLSVCNHLYDHHSKCNGNDIRFHLQMHCVVLATKKDEYKTDWIYIGIYNVHLPV